MSVMVESQVTMTECSGQAQQPLQVHSTSDTSTAIAIFDGSVRADVKAWTVATERIRIANPLDSITDFGERDLSVEGPCPQLAHELWQKNRNLQCIERSPNRMLQTQNDHAGYP
ncbi:hypothetical protein HPB48_008502 [Haemaphysalis longicornis]|uniref:Uncharacterized protein n=1 Tax=Haemaphysalis longicornis TaxID=44386 RepID=A0A9J6GJK4_HAELO|nr:hypothetical protein HPB48_008502 [Haemaphysalis longicornis]